MHCDTLSYHRCEKYFRSFILSTFPPLPRNMAEKRGSKGPENYIFHFLPPSKLLQKKAFEPYQLFAFWFRIQWWTGSGFCLTEPLWPYSTEPEPLEIVISITFDGNLIRGIFSFISEKFSYWAQFCTKKITNLSSSSVLQKFSNSFREKVWFGSAELRSVRFGQTKLNLGMVDHYLR